MGKVHKITYSFLQFWMKSPSHGYEWMDGWMRVITLITVMGLMCQWFY